MMFADDEQHNIAAYRRGCRCPICRAANTARTRIIRASLRARPGETPHGANGYDNWGCRCPVCRRAARRRKIRYELLRELHAMARSGTLTLVVTEDLRHPEVSDPTQRSS